MRAARRLSSSVFGRNDPASRGCCACVLPSADVPTLADVRFEPDKNCWRVARADRLAFLVDGAAYFAAFRQAAIQARRSIAMVGWDFDTHVPLVPDGAPSDGFPRALLAFLNSLCEKRPALSIHVLAWDFSVIYTFEREPLPAVKFRWRSHRRLRFALDGEHPVGASHHQKFVVIDDRLAFVGGMDLTFARWDTPEHRANDARRASEDGSIARPMHDVQVAAGGEIAAALGDLFRARWQAATGQTLPRPSPSSDPSAVDPWPAGLARGRRRCRGGHRPHGSRAGAASARAYVKSRR